MLRLRINFFFKYGWGSKFKSLLNEETYNDYNWAKFIN